MSSMRAFEKRIARHFDVLARCAGPALEDVLGAPEEAAASGLSAEATYALGVIVGAAGTLEVSPRELLDELAIWPARPAPAFVAPPYRTPTPLKNV